MLIRKLKIDEIESFSQLAIRSKASWGYSTEFMEACKNELQIKKNQFENEAFDYWVAEKEGESIGFYALERVSKAELELEALFVEPDHLGSGVGRALLKHAINESKKLGAAILTIQSDPNAENFYLAAGAVLTGTRESESVPGRFLPTFSISLVDV